MSANGKVCGSVRCGTKMTHRYSISNASEFPGTLNNVFEAIMSFGVWYHTSRRPLEIKETSSSSLFIIHQA